MKTVGNVYATDAILACLMCCTRSNYSWDIVIEKVGDKLFFDKRDNTEFGKSFFILFLRIIIIDYVTNVLTILFTWYFRFTYRQ